MSTTTSKGIGNTTEARGRMTEKEHIVESLGLLGKDRDELRECVIAMSHEAAMYKQERDALKASNAALVEALREEFAQYLEMLAREYPSAQSLGGTYLTVLLREKCSMLRDSRARGES